MCPHHLRRVAGSVSLCNVARRTIRRKHLWPLARKRSPSRPAPVARSEAELLAGATDRRPMSHTDSKSGARMERVVIDGEPYVAKWMSFDDDWTMRCVGDLGCKTLQLWEHGILDALPECINQPIVGCAHDPDIGPGGKQTIVLMRDIGKWTVPEGDEPISLEQHLGFLDHMAQMQARFWDFEDRFGLTPMANRYMEASPWMIETEVALDSDAFIPPLMGRGWDLLPGLAPTLAKIVMPLALDPSPLIDAYGDTPTTLIHGNWKFGNLGTDDAGRTVLFDWEAPGAAPGCVEFAWYLCLNTARLPHSKKDAIRDYRAALERHGIDSAGWFEHQLEVALLGAMVQFGWEKALGGRGPELEWWEQRAVEGERHLS